MWVGGQSGRGRRRERKGLQTRRLGRERRWGKRKRGSGTRLTMNCRMSTFSEMLAMSVVQPYLSPRGAEEEIRKSAGRRRRVERTRAAG